MSVTIHLDIENDGNLGSSIVVRDTYAAAMENWNFCKRQEKPTTEFLMGGKQKISISTDRIVAIAER